MFNKHASEFGLKPIMLAAFAMQESTCNPATVGGGGEQGLMQLTQDKCGAAPGGDCRDPVSLSCCCSSRLAFGALAHDIGGFFFLCRTITSGRARSTLPTRSRATGGVSSSRLGSTMAGRRALRRCVPSHPIHIYRGVSV
jgi:hypothetical protein